MSYRSFEDLWAEIGESDSYYEQEAILDFSIELHALMVKRNLTKKDIAQRLGVSPAYVTKVFKGEANFTIGSMVRLAKSLNGKLQLHVVPEEEGVGLWFRVLNGGKAQSQSHAWGTCVHEENISDEVVAA